MTDLFPRVLLWHKLICMQTGAITLCAAKRTLNRVEAKGWADGLRAVADDIDAFLITGQFVLDSKGQRVVRSAGEDRVVSFGTAGQEARHALDTNESQTPDTRAVSRKAGGLRIATRKKQ